MRSSLELRAAAAVVSLLLPCASACREEPAGVGEPCSGPGSCEQELVCCSSDATALDLNDLAATVLPIYPGRNQVGGEPLFSADANDRSRRGTCIRPGSVAPAFALDNACPVPCNPTWSAADIEAVCGAGTRCCQLFELEAEDCVLDPELGDEGCWRPVTGADIGVLTSWGVDEHATHQDPGLLADGACASLVAGLPAELDADAVRRACERRLGVANQRGFCLGGPDFGGCPLTRPDYRDPCEQLNDEQGRSSCEDLESP